VSNKKTAEIVTVDHDPSPMAVLQQAVMRGDVAIDVMERLQEMVYRHQDREAQRSFVTALHEFQRRCPPITRNRTADVATRQGGSFRYRYADLDQVVETIAPILREVGLSYAWDSRVEGDRLSVTCTLRHIEGHSVESSFVCPTESRAGMSEAQKYGAALSYGKRQSLVAVLGLSASDPDTDGRPVTAEEDRVTSEQAAEIEKLLAAKDRDTAKFLEWAGVESLDQLPVSRYREAKRMLARAEPKP